MGTQQYRMREAAIFCTGACVIFFCRDRCGSLPDTYILRFEICYITWHMVVLESLA